MSTSSPESLEKRHDLRLDAVFSVLLETPMGEFLAVARNVSSGGMFIETRDPLPLRTRVIVRFQIPDSDDEIVAEGEVKNHYFLNFAGAREQTSLTGMGVRFTSFDAEGRMLLNRHLYRTRVLH
jgi:uncharacterized protein (TIGR02266 family)